jgi:two-component system chemotaxis response regulator CheY
MTDNARSRVLIVDDAALVRTYYRSALEPHGFVVEEALNGLVNMPQMDGITFLRILRSKELPVSGVPVLVTSTEAGPQDMAAARSAGANYYLVKPVKPETLAEYTAIFCGAPR